MSPAGRAEPLFRMKGRRSCKVRRQEMQKAAARRPRHAGGTGRADCTANRQPGILKSSVPPAFPPGDAGSGAGGRTVFSSSRATRAGIHDVRRRSPLVSLFEVAAESLFATLFPSDCRLCGAALTEVSRLPVCSACVGSIRRIAAKTCAVCGELVSSADAGRTGEVEIRCGMCQRARLPFAKAVAYGSYDGALRGLIHLLKYDRVRPAADVLGRMAAEAMVGLKFASAERAPLVVPVPLWAGRERQRGFNQAEEIARAAVRESTPTLAPKSAARTWGTIAMELSSGALRRTRE